MTQLGFRTRGHKVATLVPQGDAHSLPERIPFYVIPTGWILPREAPAIYKEAVFTWPFDVLSARWAGNHEERMKKSVYHGEFTRREGRWGTHWRAEFDGFTKPGVYQIETERQFSLPFQVGDNIYERLVRGYMIYLHSQRAGCEVPGIRPAENVDDAVLDTDGSYVPASGGWFDAGDTRKWMSLTAFNVEGLYAAWHCGPAFRTQVLDEIDWGNRWMHAMVSPEGQVWEDIGGGTFRGESYEESWWVENHPGGSADNTGNTITDNIPMSGDERTIRTTYNPWVQFGFVRHQAMASTILPPTDSAKCLFLAEKAWRVGVQRGHDRRTLFVSAQLRAALELVAAGSKVATAGDVTSLARELLSRQDPGGEGLSHYFLEKDATDAFRCIAFSCDPPLTLLHLCELKPASAGEVVAAAEQAVRNYIDHYLLADAASNPYGVTPYGAFIQQPHPEAQTYRPAGRGRGVRTFINPFNKAFLIHGTNGVVMAQAHLLARAGKYFGNAAYSAHAELLLQWSMGHNPTGLSTFTGIGCRHPVPYSLLNLSIPEAVLNGFVGRPDDSPYLETGNTSQWNTQEVWGIPYMHAMGAIANL